MILTEMLTHQSNCLKMQNKLQKDVLLSQLSKMKAHNFFLKKLEISSLKWVPRMFCLSDLEKHGVSLEFMEQVNKSTENKKEHL